MSHFSIGILKGILNDNHVHVGAILEKEELVRKVWTLIEAEREDRERQRVIEEVEEAERQARINELREQREKDQGQQSTSSPPPAASTAPPPKATSYTERQGLCVICQDEEANIAIVDCGYVSLCLSNRPSSHVLAATLHSVEVVQNSSCRVRGNVLYVGRALSLMPDYCVFSRLSIHVHIYHEYRPSFGYSQGSLLDRYHPYAFLTADLADVRKLAQNRFGRRWV